MTFSAPALTHASHRVQVAEAKDRKARKAAQQTVSQAKGRLGKYEERLKELAATPGVPKVEVGSLEEVCLCSDGPLRHQHGPIRCALVLLRLCALLVTVTTSISDRFIFEAA